MQEAYQQINELGTFSEYKLRMIQILTEKLNFNRWRGNSPMPCIAQRENRGEPVELQCRNAGCSLSETDSKYALHRDGPFKFLSIKSADLVVYSVKRA